MPAGFDGPKKTIEYLDRLVVKMDTGVDKVLKKHAQNIQKNARDAAPKRTGFLRAQIKITEVKDGYMVGAYAPYSIFQEEGTRRIKGQFFFKNAVDEEMKTMTGPELLKELGIK